jgi:hypothetical protein
MKEKKLLLTLIKDDMINLKLVNGLNAIGLSSGNYFLHLSETIFELMGFKDTERTEHIYQRYIQLTNKVMFIDISESHMLLDKLADEIYGELAKELLAY